MSKKYIADTLKRLREAVGLTTTQVGDIIGKSGKTVSAWENGRGQPDAEILIQLCDIYKVNNLLAEFDESDNLKKESTISDTEISMINKYRSLDSYGKNVVDMVLAAECERVQNQEQERERTNIVKTVSLRINDNSVSAGFGNILDDYENWDTVLVPLTPESRKADFILRVSGDSMEPMFSDGDCVLVHRQECVEQGEIGIFCVNDNGYIKKFGKNVLISLNKKYPEIPLDNDSRCFGKVLGKAEIFD